MRQQETDPLPTLLGSDMGEARPSSPIMAQLADTFHVAKVSAKWRQIEPREGHCDWSAMDAQVEACRQHGLRICVGPLLPAGTTSLPDWLIAWEGDFEDLMATVLRQVESAVTRYRGQVQLWHVASRINLAGALSLTPQQRLEMVIRAVEVTGRLDPQTAKIVSFDQIWGEAKDHQGEEIEPLQLADAFVRANLGLGGFGLELNIGYYPGGTSQRDMLAFSRQLDMWSLLGLPLLITLVVPSSSADDPQAVADRHGEPPRVCFGADRELPSPASQQAWIARYIPLMLAKNGIQLIVWNQLDDRQPHGFPHGGLVDSTGRVKLALATLSDIRKEYLA
ncbi:MAG: endo-1,4-beta-xylanase, partial [Pirellulales bacterium]